MHVVKKIIAPESKTVTWQVGWVDGLDNWTAVFESEDREDTFYVCSWLNGGDAAVFYLRRGK